MAFDFTRLEELLSDETFPHEFPVKFIGANTATFTDGVRDFEAMHPQLSKKQSHPSTNAKYLSLTYTFLAQTPAEIIAMLKAASQIPDVSVVL